MGMVRVDEGTSHCRLTMLNVLPPPMWGLGLGSDLSQTRPPIESPRLC